MSEPSPPPAAELVARALAGDVGGVRSLVDLLTPVIHARVARVLMRNPGGRSGRSLRPEIEDLGQDVFVALFANQGRVLKTWDPERGLSLLNFVGLVAERQALSLVRSARRNPFTEDPTLSETLERQRPEVDSVDVEALVSSRRQLAALLAALKERLSPTGLQLFRGLIVEERPIQELGQETGLSDEALYAWRSRLKKLCRRLASQTDDPPREAKRTTRRQLGDTS